MKSPYGLVANAAKPDASRWTLRVLLSVEPDLYAMFRGQQRLWEAALVTGEDADVNHQTTAMVRMGQAIARRMEDMPDDACLLGVCLRTETKVAIGDQIEARARRVRDPP
jgi:hypothetical protein